MIPMRKNRKVRKTVDMAIYTLRILVERCFNKLKNSRRLQPATTKPQTVSSASPTLPASGYGFAICQHALGSGLALVPPVPILQSALHNFHQIGGNEDGTRRRIGLALLNDRLPPRSYCPSSPRTSRTARSRTSAENLFVVLLMCSVLLRNWNLRQTGAGQNRAMIRPMLKAGYGMEDIAVKTGPPRPRNLISRGRDARKQLSLRVISNGKPRKRASGARIA